jgi:hypothetical protein
LRDQPPNGSKAGKSLAVALLLAALDLFLGNHTSALILTIINPQSLLTAFEFEGGVGAEFHAPTAGVRRFSPSHSQNWIRSGRFIHLETEEAC